MSRPRAGTVIWIDRKFLPEEQARISPFDRGLWYGDGIFETMRSDAGVIHRLAGHLTRFRSGLRALRIDPPRRIEWRKILGTLLECNGLADGCARIRLQSTRGETSGRGLPHSRIPTLFATAERYTPPSTLEYRRGWTLAPPSVLRSNSTSRLKSSSYLDCRIAVQNAIDEGADDALLLDVQGNVCETGTASILFRRNGHWHVPSSPNQLRSVTRRAVIALMQESGVDVRPAQLPVDEIASVERLWIANAMLGIMRVRAVGEVVLPDPSGHEAEALRLRLFS